MMKHPACAFPCWALDAGVSPTASVCSTRSWKTSVCLCILAQKQKALLSSSPPSLPRSRFRGIVKTQSFHPVEQHQQHGQAQRGTAGLAVSPSSAEGAVWQDCWRSLFPCVVTPSSFNSSVSLGFYPFFLFAMLFFLLTTLLCPQVKGLPYGKKKLSWKLGGLIKASPDSMNNHQTLNWTKWKAIQMETEGCVDLP